MASADDMVLRWIIIGVLVAVVSAVLLVQRHRASESGLNHEASAPTGSGKPVGTSAIGHGGPAPAEPPRASQLPPAGAGSP